jgi:hypothetical protein
MHPAAGPLIRIVHVDRARRGRVRNPVAARVGRQEDALPGIRPVHGRRLMRIVIAGIIGGIVMFIWTAVAHMVLPIGEMGVELPAAQQATLAAIATSATSGEGVYMYPSMAPEQWGDEAAMAAFVEQNRDSAYAFVVYRPDGNPALAGMTPNLVTQFVSVTLAGLFAAWLLSLGTSGFGRRVLIAGGLGLFAWLAISVPYWNWYLFPTALTIGNALEQIIGWLLAGAAIAWWLGRSERAATQPIS